MKIKIKIADTEIELDEVELVAVPKQKYADVDICIKTEKGGFLFLIAVLYINDGSYKDKEAQFEALSDFAKKLCKAWNKRIKPISKDAKELHIPIVPGDTPEVIRCPECLEKISQEELDTFGGLCENCMEAGQDG